MKRRDAVLAPLALGSLGFPASAQQEGKVWRIGNLSQGNGHGEYPLAFAEGMRTLGDTEGRNTSFVHRFSVAQWGLLPNLAAADRRSAPLH